MQFKAILGLLFLISPLAHSQALIQADTTTIQAQIGRDESGFKSCGVRVIASLPGKPSEMYDFSIALYRSTYGGLMKAGKYVISDKDIERRTLPSPVTPLAKKFWISTDVGAKPLVAQKISASESKGFILGVGDLVQSLDTVMAIASSKNMQFVLRYPSEGLDRVIGFSGALPESDMRSLMACMDQIIDSFGGENDAVPK